MHMSSAKPYNLFLRFNKRTRMEYLLRYTNVLLDVDPVNDCLALSFLSLQFEIHISMKLLLKCAGNCHSVALVDQQRFLRTTLLTCKYVES